VSIPLVSDQSSVATLSTVSLEDKFSRTDGTIYLNGVQALVRLLLTQARNDRLAGHNTAGFVSGYRGSPLGGLDFALWNASRQLEAANIRFEPGLNEDIAATAIWGTQQTDIFGGAKVDGVFGMWYGKNPGVDRTGDVFKHANMNGVSRLGGVLAISGDDPGASSSSIPNQCEHAFISAMSPVIYPADVSDILEMGLFGYAASRYSGLWLAMKTVADTLETTGTVLLPDAPTIYLPPEDFEMPAEGVEGRWPDDRFAQDRRLQEIKMPALLAFARTNSIDRMVINPPRKRFGIAAAGKAYLDVRQALASLGVNDRLAAELGIAVYKVGMVWPLEPHGAAAFADGLEELLVVEERRSILETQFKELSYHWPAGRRPRIIGKRDENNAPVVPSIGETNPRMLAEIIAQRLARSIDHPAVKNFQDRLIKQNRPVPTPAPTAFRTPYFCAGCPHARSTQLPAGSRAMAGIGCHSLAMWVPGSDTLTITQMGGEGANWIGLAPYIEEEHIFQNLGDGTYYHSGLLAIRAAVAANSRITYKILYNSAVAMTGGQPVEGAPSVADIAWQAYAEGVGKIVIVAEEPERHTHGPKLPPDVAVHAREAMDEVMIECRDWTGVSMILFDQQCATEKRRDRKKAVDILHETRVFINDAICEGCGDCSVKAHCLAIQVKQTPFGPKRQIDQSTCNLDNSCIDGFCPSFVTVTGRKKRRNIVDDITAPVFEHPPVNLPTIEGTYDIVVAGVGGTGLITVGAILGMAAHLEGKHCTVLDNTGLARKGGGVTTHVRIARDRAEIFAARLAQSSARLLISGDVVVSTATEVLTSMRPFEAKAVVNHHQLPTSVQALDPEARFPGVESLDILSDCFGPENLQTADVTVLSEGLFGDGIFANIMLLGMAYQWGAVPLGEAAILRAIEMNGVAADTNKTAFNWGRRLTHNPAAVRQAAGAAHEPSPPSSLETVIARRADFLESYQDKAYAGTYRALVAKAAEAEAGIVGAAGEFADAVARGMFKLMAYKDEYEVARLMTRPEFLAEIEAAFDGETKITLHLAPPFLPRSSTSNGKRTYGGWMLGAMRVLAKFKGMRGTAFDPFGYQAERRVERGLIERYRGEIEALLGALSADNLQAAIDLAQTPDAIRGFGHIKTAAIAKVAAHKPDLLAAE
jgi:indolepyruvate ferredoxin oxidoreductase